MAKSTSNTSIAMPKGTRVKLDPFNGVLAIFFLVFALALPVAMPASDGRLNVLHHVGMAVLGLLSAFFMWRWLRAQLAQALYNEVDQEVAKIRATTFAEDAAAQSSPPKT